MSVCLHLASILHLPARPLRSKSHNLIVSTGCVSHGLSSLLVCLQPFVMIPFSCDIQTSSCRKPPDPLTQSCLPSQTERGGGGFFFFFFLMQRLKLDEISWPSRMQRASLKKKKESVCWENRSCLQRLHLESEPQYIIRMARTASGMSRDLFTARTALLKPLPSFIFPFC